MQTKKKPTTTKRDKQPLAPKQGLIVKTALRVGASSAQSCSPGMPGCR